MAEEELKDKEAESLETEDEEKTNSLMNWLNEHPKTTFWSRFVLWALCAGVLPFLFIVLRFKLFSKVSQLQIGGWGIIAIILAAFFILTIIRYIKLAFSAKYSLTGQILGGICKIILPLGVFMAILVSVRDSVDTMIQVMGVVIACELVAIPLNPLPKWAHDMQKDVRDSEKKEAMDYLLDGFFKRKKDEGNP